MKILILAFLVFFATGVVSAEKLTVTWLTSNGELKNARSGALMNGTLVFLCGDSLIGVSSSEKTPYQIGDSTFGSQLTLAQDNSSDAPDGEADMFFLSDRGGISVLNPNDGSLVLQKKGLGQENYKVAIGTGHGFYAITAQGDLFEYVFKKEASKTLGKAAFKNISFLTYADKLQHAVEHLIGLDAKGRYYRILEDGTKAYVEAVDVKNKLKAAVFLDGRLIEADEQGNLTAVDPDLFNSFELGSIGPFQLLLSADDRLYVVDLKGNLGEVRLPK